MNRITTVLSALLTLCTISPVSAAVAQADWRWIKPDAMIDLRTPQGVQLVQGQWRARAAGIVEVDHRGPGPDLKASGSAVRTHDLLPQAGAAEFDDRDWEVIDPTTLEARRGNGRLSFVWYRLHVTIPGQIGTFETAGATAIFEIVADDYSEVWVNGALPQVLGQNDGKLASGWNAPNRVILGRNVRPGDRFQIAVLAANAPLSQPPANFVWIRSACVKFFTPQRFESFETMPIEVQRFDPALDAILPPDAKVQKLADGFGFTEGPVWVPPDTHEGYLLFSDPNNNNIYRWSEDGAVSIYRANSGYSGFDVGRYRQPGSNGLALDPQGRLTICEHGNRRITRLEKNGTLTVLADKFEGKRLNSPNDLVYRSDGALFFTDPFFGLPEFHDDPDRELPFTGVFCLIDGELKLVSEDLKGPNGIALSPDEKHLYVANWDEQRKIVMRYDARTDGSLINGIVFADLTSESGPEALDGLKVDLAGNVFVAGPGGMWVFSAQGKQLGLIRFPQLPANFAWGDAARTTLYLTARSGLYRMNLHSRPRDAAAAAAVEQGQD